LKVLRIIRSLHPSGGGPVDGLRQSIPCLANYGIETTVLSLDTPDSSPWLNDLPCETIAVGPVYGGYGFRSGLVRIIRDLSSCYHHVIIEGLWQYHSRATWLALRNSSCSYFVYTHGMLDPWFKRTYPLKHLKKAIYWHLAEYNLLRDASGVLFTTLTECHLARQSFSRYSAREYVVGYGASACPHPSQIDYSAYYKCYPELLGKEVYLFLGRIHPKKGVDLLISAFSQIARHNQHRHLVLAGPVSSSYHSYLDCLIRSLSIETQVTWTGHLDGDMKWAAYSSSSLFCLPSHQENFGVSVAEALSASLPVAISCAVNIADRVQATGSGFVRPDTTVGTFDALQSWSSLDPDQRLLMSQRAYSLFINEFQWTQVSDRLARLLYDSESLPYI